MTWDTSLNGWGKSDEIEDLPEVSAADSDAISALMRQIRKGTYAEVSLRAMISKTKGERPKDFLIKDIPKEIRRVGNRWGVTYDVATGNYHVWGGGTPTKGYIPSYTGPIKEGWKEFADEIIRYFPNKIYTFSTFKAYFINTTKELGYSGKYPMGYIVDSILQKRLRVEVTVMDKKVDVHGGRARKIYKSNK